MNEWVVCGGRRRREFFVSGGSRLEKYNICVVDIGIVRE